MTPGLSLGLGLGLTRQRRASSALARVQAAAPDFVAWWTSADPTSMLLAADGVGGFVSASGQTVGGWLNVKDCGSKSFAQHLAAQPELVTNGGFDSDSAWADISTGTATATIASGVLTITGTDASNRGGRDIAIPTVVGRHYLVGWENVSGSGAYTLGGNTASALGGSTVFAVTGHSKTAAIFRATTTTTYLYAQTGSAGATRVIDNVSVKELGTLPLLQASGASKPQYLLSGGIGSVNADGSDDHLSTGALASALPSDCAVYARVKTTDNRGYIFSGAATDSNEYFFCFQDGLTSPVYGNVGSPTLYVDDAEFTGHRGDYYDAISDGAQHSLVARSIDLSGLAALTLAAYLPSPSVNYVAAAFGDILIVPEALLTAKPTLHADIMAMMAARYPS